MALPKQIYGGPMPLIFYSVTEARDRMEKITGHPYTRQAIIKAVKIGRLPSHRLGNAILVSEESLVKYIEQWGRRPASK